MLSSDDKRRHRVRIPFYLPAVTLTLPKYTPENWIEYRAEVMAACKAAHPDLIRMIGGTLEKPLDTAPTASDWQSVYRWKCGVHNPPLVFSVPPLSRNRCVIPLPVLLLYKYIYMYAARGARI